MTPKCILLIDDDPFLVSGLKTLLTDEGYRVRTAGDIAQARGILVEASPDLFIIDLNLPDGSGLELLKEIRENGRPPAPAMILTGAATTDNFRESFMLAADEYVRKPVGAATLLTLIERLTAQEYKSRWLLPADNVIRLRPLVYLTHLMEREDPHPHRFLVVADARAVAERQSDIGEEEVNTLLKKVLFDFLFSLKHSVDAGRFEAVLTETGADMVVSILLDRDREESLNEVVARAARDVEQHMQGHPTAILHPVTVKCVSFQPDSGGHPGRALYLALQRARPAQRIALAKIRMVPFLQAICTAGGRRVGYELLNRPQGFQNTGYFYRNLEALHLHGVIDIRNVDSALPILLRIPRGLFLSINISPGSLLQKGFTYHLLRKLNPYADRVVLEITERDPMLCTSPVLHKIEMLRKFGFGIALDDVGAGYNNLLGLTRIRPQMVKVDKTLIHGLAQDSFRAEAVRFIIQLARKMHAVVVAEGVERQDDVEALAFMDIDMVQGFFFHVPEPAAVVLGRLVVRKVVSHELATTG